MVQNQHYVPKFILRQFLTDAEGERVAVYDKHSDRKFVTSIRNVMAENRFNDFTFDDNWIASFEPIACAIEEIVLPVYHKVIENRKLENTPQEKADLAILVAFQFLRTKANRSLWKHLESAIVTKVEAIGGKMQNIKGWEDWKPATEDSLKQDHLLSIQSSIWKFAGIIGGKDFLLAEPAEGRSFYLGDNPVCLNNANQFGPYGNLGLAVKGIEIYMPLAYNLLLCAWCPSILSSLRSDHYEGKKARRAESIEKVISGTLPLHQLQAHMERLMEMERPVDMLLSASAEGRPMASSESNMDFYNSLQTSSASRYIICQQADFDLAQRFCRENPSAGQEHGFTFG